MRAKAARRQRFIRALLAFLLLASIFITSGIFYLKSRISPQTLSQEASALLRSRFGLALSVGELELTWTGNARLRQICIRNEKMRSERCLLSADIVELDLALLPLLRKEIHVRGLAIAQCEINLFSEKIETTEKKSQIRRSWEIEFPGQVSGTDSEPSTAQTVGLQLHRVEIQNGVIAHEAEALPLPLGRIAFAAALRHSGKELRLNLDLPDRGHIAAELELRIADFRRAAQRLITELHLPENDRITGNVICTHCHLVRLDARVQYLTGKLKIDFIGTELQISSQDAQITTSYTYAPLLSWNGTVKLKLKMPQLYPLSGEGTLTGQGLLLAYAQLAGNDKTGIAADFTASIDLARLPKIAGFKGELKAQGSIRNGSVDAHFHARNFATDKAPIAITAEHLTGELRAGTISLRRQKVNLGKNAAEVSLDVKIKDATKTLTGSVAFAELNLDDWLKTNTAASSGGAFPSTKKNSLPFSAQLVLSASSLKYNNVQSGKFAALLAASGQSGELQLLGLEFGRGRITGSYRHEISGRRNIHLKISGIRMQDMKALLPWQATIYGVLDAEINGSFTGTTLGAVLQSGKGNLHVQIGRGKIKDSFLQKGIFNGPLHKLEDKFADIEFASATAEARLDGGKLHIPKLVFDAEEWNVTYRAESDSTGQGRAELVFRFRESFVANVANPLHLGIADRKDGDFYDLPFACRGKVASGECYQRNW